MITALIVGSALVLGAICGSIIESKEKNAFLKRSLMTLHEQIDAGIANMNKIKEFQKKEDNE